MRSLFLLICAAQFALLSGAHAQSNPFSKGCVNSFRANVLEGQWAVNNSPEVDLGTVAAQCRKLNSGFASSCLETVYEANRVEGAPPSLAEVVTDCNQLTSDSEVDCFQREYSRRNGALPEVKAAVKSCLNTNN